MAPRLYRANFGFPRSSRTAQHPRRLLRAVRGGTSAGFAASGLLGMDLTLEPLIAAIGASKLRAATYLPHEVRGYAQVCLWSSAGGIPCSCGFVTGSPKLSLLYEAHLSPFGAPPQPWQVNAFCLMLGFLLMAMAGHMSPVRAIQV